MSEPLLTVLKFCFLALLYLFLARVVRVVVLELRAGGPPVVLAPDAPPQERRHREARGTLSVRIVEPPARQGESYAVSEELTVGRAGGCAVVLADDTFVSQVHARVFPHNGRVWVEDLGSRNGTFLNGERVTAPARLRRGDRLQVGQTLLEVAR